MRVTVAFSIHGSSAIMAPASARSSAKMFLPTATPPSARRGRPRGGARRRPDGAHGEARARHQVAARAPGHPDDAASTTARRRRAGRCGRGGRARRSAARPSARRGPGGRTVVVAGPGSGESSPAIGSGGATVFGRGASGLRCCRGRAQVRAGGVARGPPSTAPSRTELGTGVLPTSLRVEARLERAHGVVDVARAERDHHVAGPHDAVEHLGEIVLVVHVAGVVVAVLADRLDEPLRGDARDGRFARGVDVGDERARRPG